MKAKTPEKRNFPIVFYTLCMCAYIILKMHRNSLDAVQAGTGGVWNVANILFVGMAFYVLLTKKRALSDRPSCINWAIAYSTISFFLSLFFITSINIAKVFSLLMIFFFPSVIVVFFTYSKRGVPPFAEKVFLFVFYAVALFATFLMLNRAQGTTEIYQSDVYFALCLFPFALLFGKKISFYLPLLLVVASVILSAKRTATLALFAALLLFYFVQVKQSREFKAFFKTIMKVGLVVIIIFAIYSYLSSTFEINIIERLQGLQEDGGSGRDDIYMGLLRSIRDSHPLYWFTGYGNNAVINVYGRTSAAHNDFIEIMYDYGIFAIFAILGFYISMIKECLKMIKAQFYGAPAFAASIVIAAFMSMFSNFMITFTHIIGISAFWGICLAKWKNFKTPEDLNHNLERR